SESSGWLSIPDNAQPRPAIAIVRCSIDLAPPEIPRVASRRLALCSDPTALAPHLPGRLLCQSASISQKWRRLAPCSLNSESSRTGADKRFAPEPIANRRLVVI